MRTICSFSYAVDVYAISQSGFGEYSNLHESVQALNQSPFVIYTADPFLRKQFATKLPDMSKTLVFLWKTLEDTVEDVDTSRAFPWKT